jgi:phosphoglycolate phosphatase-like HAD superfamily hydrolase
MRLVLFDIDGTLVDCGPSVRSLFAEAMVEAFGTAGPIDGYDFCGRTDDEIVFALTAAAGLTPEDVRQRLPLMKQLYLERLGDTLDLSEMRILPAVTGLLDELSTRTDVFIGLLTGNWRDGAQIKLTRVGLDRFFAFGAFGDDQPDRFGLPPVALERATAVTGRRWQAEECLIVGDSPADVACARAHGIPALAVATGRTSAEHLAAAGPHWLVDDLVGQGSHPAFTAVTA